MIAKQSISVVALGCGDHGLAKSTTSRALLEKPQRDIVDAPMPVEVKIPFETKHWSGRDSYFVRFQNIHDRSVTVEVYRIDREPGHGDFGFEKPFGLQLLCIPPQYLGRQTYPLLERMPMHLLNEQSFLDQHTNEFIEQFDDLEARNYPIDEAALVALSDDEYTTFWNTPENLPYIRYQLTVTDARWIEHLEEGFSYLSAALLFE